MWPLNLTAGMASFIIYLMTNKEKNYGDTMRIYLALTISSPRFFVIVSLT